MLLEGVAEQHIVATSESLGKSLVHGPSRSVRIDTTKELKSLSLLISCVDKVVAV